MCSCCKKFSITIYDHILHIDPGIVLELASERVLQQYFQVAVITILVYDAIITMDNELSHLKIRYTGIIGAISRSIWGINGVNLAISSGNFSLWTQDIANWITGNILDYILMICVVALYAQACLRMAFVVYIQVVQKIDIGALVEGVITCGEDVLLPWQFGVVDWYAIQCCKERYLNYQ
ncbi:uncharacterized protein FOMMEDRAFT_26996 [Fomitiporia mediterranea MF3/22]|uniref:uncharacterized protein n=1 Tax=Fomitiporia mediterranea (strain MF3/22) TaxID=694068 RepID=UPI00044091DA|nr:uncharacterized protein FOMMEDRAFT_26996 [Fomitiporia mediterranea MF3/22]EJD06280.1 hypothetical protein FOMMEDRAFT_26996 [Fomitiporia mediterranea MF3/22]